MLTTTRSTFQVVSHVGAFQKLSELAQSSLTAGSNEEHFFKDMDTSGKGR